MDRKKSKAIDAVKYLADEITAGRETEVETRSRRVWLQNAAALTASGALLWACGNDDKKKSTNSGSPSGTSNVKEKKDKQDSEDNKNQAQETSNTKSDEYTTEQMTEDANTMNVALDLEHEAIALYTAAAGLGIWEDDATNGNLASTLLEKTRVGDLLREKQFLEEHDAAIAGIINVDGDNVEAMMEHLQELMGKAPNPAPVVFLAGRRMMDLAR